MPKRTIPIARLRVGMYLADLDRSWLHTPFLRHSFLIKDEQEIAALRKAGIAKVVIDTDLGLDSGAQEATPENQPTSPPQATLRPEAAVIGVDHEPVEARNSTELAQGPPSPHQLAAHFSEAKRQREQWIARAKALFERTRATDVIDTKEARYIVDEVLESLLERQAACLAVLGLGQPDPDLQEHGLAVCTLSLTLGKSLNLSDDRLRQLGMGGLLHDIGLVKLPRNIIKRPKAMAPAQQMLYETHTEEGVRILRKSGIVETDLLSIVKNHHRLNELTKTAMDGNIDIDLGKLAGAVDQYDELLTGQTGLPPMSSNQVLTQLYQRFHAYPDWSVIVSSLIRIIGIYPLYSVVLLTSGEVGIVAAITPGKAHLPYLYICRDEFQRPCIPPKPLDLNQEPEGGRRVKEVLSSRQCKINIEQTLEQVAA
ncbi:MAG: DUF3391 domain-containing protein [Nitrospira sp.]|nr:DUF3391 domain-containing protein [Nitrospira sp.]